jgi:hypothetical protein
LDEEGVPPELSRLENTRYSVYEILPDSDPRVEIHKAAITKHRDPDYAALNRLPLLTEKKMNNPNRERGLRRLFGDEMTLVRKLTDTNKNTRLMPYPVNMDKINLTVARQEDAYWDLTPLKGASAASPSVQSGNREEELFEEFYDNDQIQAFFTDLKSRPRLRGRAEKVASAIDEAVERFLKETDPGVLEDVFVQKKTRSKAGGPNMTEVERKLRTFLKKKNKDDDDGDDDDHDDRDD